MQIWELNEISLVYVLYYFYMYVVIDIFECRMK